MPGHLIRFRPQERRKVCVFIRKLGQRNFANLCANFCPPAWGRWGRKKTLFKRVHKGRGVPQTAENLPIVSGCPTINSAQVKEEFQQNVNIFCSLTTTASQCVSVVPSSPSTSFIVMRKGSSALGFFRNFQISILNL